MLAFVGVIAFARIVVGTVNGFTYSLQHNDSRLATQIIVTIFVLIALCPLVRGAFAAAIVESSGIKVRNPWHTRFFGWKEIQSFTLHDPPFGPSYGRVELTDGGHYHIFGITTGNMPRWERESRMMIGELNEILGSHKESPGATQLDGGPTTTPTSRAP
jgi:hypothetical protein